MPRDEGDSKCKGPGVGASRHVGEAAEASGRTSVDKEEGRLEMRSG